MVFVVGCLVQVGLAWWLEPRLLILLAVAWVYLALMGVEFFARDWLVARPIHYLWTHMLIMPLVDLFATGCDWLPAGSAVHGGLVVFLFVSFLNGLVIEFGRKLRAVEDEEEGVPTYTRLWGVRLAPMIWLGAMTGCGILAVIAARGIEFSLPVGLVLGSVLILATWAALRFRKQSSSSNAKVFEKISGVWTLALYLMLGLIPMLVQNGLPS